VTDSVLLNLDKNGNARGRCAGDSVGVVSFEEEMGDSGRP
jgi:hypothetical protein